jgi:hypothetical protein
MTRSLNRWRRRHWPPIPCADCAVDLVPTSPWGSHDWQRYMVHDDVWAAAGMAPLDGWLCIPCLERRLGWPLTGADFPPLPLNDLDADKDPHRLAELKRAAAQHHATRST